MLQTSDEQDLPKGSCEEDSSSQGKQATESLRIDESERKSWIAIAFIRAGGMFAAPSLMVGAALGLGLSLSGAAWAILAGFGFIVLYMSFISMQAADLGLPTASLAAPALGGVGARYIVSLVIGVVTIGWFGVQTAVCGASLAIMLENLFAIAVPVWVCSLALGTLMLATAVFGFEGIRWISSIAAPLLLVICLYGVGASLVQTGGLEQLLGYVPASEQAIGFIAGVNMAIGLFSFGGATAGDFARFAHSRKDAVLSCVAGVIPAALVALLAGASLAILMGTGDVAVIMNSIGLPAVGLISLVLSAWAVNAANVYSAGLGFTVMLGKGEGGSKMPTAISGIAGILLAVGGILGQFETFLTFLSACGPALAGALIADYWLVRKGRPENVQVIEGVSAAGVTALLCGLLVGLVTGGTFALIPGLEFLDIPFFIGPVNGLVASMLAYVVAYRLQGRERFAGRIAFVTPKDSIENNAS